MGEKTGIAWCDHTFNPWRGCVKVSPGCANCYADSQSKRSPDVLGLWGPPGVGRRVVAAESYWRLPLQWDSKAAKEGVRRRVLCGSLMDWAEQWYQPVWRDGRQLLVADDEPDRWVPRPSGSERLTPTEEQNLRNGVYRQLWLTDVRRRMFDVMRATKNLDWLLLTKRPEAVPAILTWQQGFLDWAIDNPAIWIGTSVEDQAAADTRIPALLRIPAALRFLSVEPLLGPVDLEPWLRSPNGEPTSMNHFTGPFIDWVIVGGESGPNARPCNVEWIRSIVRQSKAAGVPCFVKQLGSCVVDDYYIEDDQWRDVLLSNQHIIARCDHGLYTEVDPAVDGQPPPCSVIFGRLTHPKGGDPDEWPEDLRLREFPDV